MRLETSDVGLGGVSNRVTTVTAIGIVPPPHAVMGNGIPPGGMGLWT